MKGRWTWAAAVLAVALWSSTTRFASAHGTVTSHLVLVAAEATLENDIDDISSTGKCAATILASCQTILPGEGRQASCIMALIEQNDSGSQSDQDTWINDDCKEETYQYYIARSKNINKNIPLARACKLDAAKHCNFTWSSGQHEGGTISCLKNNKEKLSKPCQKEVFQVELIAANDWRADAALAPSCEADVTRLCKDVQPGGGRVLGCLRDNQIKLSWDCAEQVMRQETQTDDDVRLSTRLFRSCMVDKRKFCADVSPGHNMAKDCLEAHRRESGFSAGCKAELDGMIERRVRDFHMDTRLSNACQEDVYSLCTIHEDMDESSGDGTTLSLCLQDYWSEIKDETCKAMVKTYQELSSEDIRFDARLADACLEDRQKFCGNIQPGSAKVIRCLMSDRSRLSSQCRATLFDEEVRFSENIDFQYPMKKACTKEIQLFCNNVPHGNARVIRCLQDKKNDKDFGSACAKEVKNYEKSASSDYRLNFRLAKACTRDIDELCKDTCNKKEEICGGMVLRCLTENRAKLTDASCKNEVLYFQKMEVTDYHNDLLLATACREDIEKHCKDTEPGDGRMHLCLRTHRAKLTDNCRREERILEEQEADNIELRPTLLKACADERKMYCGDVTPGNARVFRCLAEKMGDADFGESCKHEIVVKLQRRQSNWKLDPMLRKACRADVLDLCKSEDSQASEHGLVLKCLITSYEDLDHGCKKELGRAVHMAFYIWQPGAIITHACDTDIQKLCLAKRPNMDRTPGAVGDCLADVLEQVAAAHGNGNRRYMGGSKAVKSEAQGAVSLSDECHVIADVAEPPNMKQAFETSLVAALLESKLASTFESTTGLNILDRTKRGHAKGVTLTGWTALVGVMSMVVLLLWGIMYAIQRYRGDPSHEGYTVVLKNKPQGRGNRFAKAIQLS